MRTVNAYNAKNPNMDCIRPYMSLRLYSSYCMNGLFVTVFFHYGDIMTDKLNNVTFLTLFPVECCGYPEK